MHLEYQALFLEVDLVVPSQEQVLVRKDVAVPHVLYGLLTFQLLLPMFVDIPYSCLLVVIADHCAVLQPQPGLGLELGLECLERLEQLEPLEQLEWPKQPQQLEWPGPLEWLVKQEEHLDGAGQSAQQTLELWDSLVILEHLPEPCLGLPLAWDLVDIGHHHHHHWGCVLVGEGALEVSPPTVPQQWGHSMDLIPLPRHFRSHQI